MDFAIALVNNLLMKMPYAETYIFSYPIGIMSYKLVLLAICGEVIVMLTKKKESV